MRRLTALLCLCLMTAAAAHAADLDACVLGSPAVVKQFTGLDMSIRKQGTPAGPGGSSSCGLKGSKPLQSLHVQLWRGASAASFYQPALYKGKEYTGNGYKAFIAHDVKGGPAHPNYSGNGGVLKGDVYVSVMFDARDQAVSAEQLKALLDHLAGQL